MSPIPGALALTGSLMPASALGAADYGPEISIQGGQDEECAKAGLAAM